jgi:hypothetical protein
MQPLLPYDIAEQSAGTKQQSLTWRWHDINTTGITSEAGTAYYSGVPLVLSGARVTQS